MALTDTPVVDCCVEHEWSAPDEVIAYLPSGWREYVALNLEQSWSAHFRSGTRRPDTPLHFPPLTAPGLFTDPDGEKLSGWDGQMSASQLRDHLAGNRVERAVLFPAQAMRIATVMQPRLTVALCRAVNDWLIEQRLNDTDSRLYGTLVVPSQLPEEAAAEIRRVGGHARIVAVSMSVSALGHPVGHLIYEPIYRAAEELGLVVVVHAGGEAAAETMQILTAGGPPATFADYYALLPQGQMSHLTSLVTQGVFERHPSLRVLMTGAGVMWAPPFLWRLDTEYKSIRTDAPWLTRLPSEYIRSNVRFATYPLDPAPSREARISWYRALPGIDNVLCYASGWPRSDASTPAQYREALPAEWCPRVMRQNALELFGWTSADDAATAVTTDMRGEADL